MATEASAHAKALSSGVLFAGALLGLDTVAPFGRQSGLIHMLERVTDSRPVVSTPRWTDARSRAPCLSVIGLLVGFWFNPVWYQDDAARCSNGCHPPTRID